jgi:benzodiazapine receptor
MRFAKALALCGTAVAATAALGGLFNPGRGTTRAWYSALEKPSFNPPDEIFAPVWTTLYVLIAISGARIASAPPSDERTRAMRWWSAQLALNAAWSPLFFGAKMPAAALADIVLMLAAIAASIAASRKVDTKAAWMMAPYLAWVAFATILNAEIVRLNAFDK